MFTMRQFYYILCSLFSLSIVMGYIPDEQRLMEVMFRNYEPASRPVYNASAVVLVKFGITLTQISDMDEVNQVLTTNVWLEQEWVDERLKWDPQDYNGLRVLRVPCNKIWLPDIVLYNSADDFTNGYMQSKAMVDNNGTVFWPPPAKFRSSCKIDITYFPFDDQLCKMKFGSWTYDGFQVDVTNRSAKVDLSNYVYSGEWELLEISVVRNEVKYACCDEPYPDVTFTIIIRRRTLYYLFNIIFPCLWLTVLSLLGFWLPPDSGEKITLGITVLLAFSVFMLLIAESMPATSEFVPLIGIYLTTTMAMTSLSIVLTVFVLQLHHVGPHERPVPEWVKFIMFKIVARLLFMRKAIKKAEYGREAKRDEMCLATFGEHHLDIKDTNCNGRLSPLQLSHDRRDRERGSVAFDKISKHLRVLVAKQTYEDNFQEIVDEWRLVAHIMDRFLFWLFFISGFVSSIVILVIRPMYKPTGGTYANT
ncbi:neuronal acetylcholine receptor subunit alpha-10-like isoform X2 [Lineus longissimus]|uniref:neuronal acetylcholine receptor subunit alpha-10-like isoform X2 n=1 Tax=Lineus longissimus TaxID=88925 RepID=UPI002B4DB3BB